MLRYPCLILDHDDTVVQSTPCINYPSFLESLAILRPGVEMPLDTFLRYSCRPGFFQLCTDILGYNEQEMEVQAEIWHRFVRTHTPKAWPGMAEILREQRARGGLICVSSHSEEENILRDYRENFGMAPDFLFTCSLPEACWKPNPYALREMMRRCNLSPGQLLVVDDLLPGCKMAHSCGVRFAAAGWAQLVPELAADLRRHGDFYCETTEDLAHLLFD